MSDKVLDSLGNEIPNLTDCSDEQFDSWVEVAPIGDVSNASNLLCQCFNQMKKVKDDLVSSLTNCTIPSDKREEATESLKTMYPMLQRLEDRIFKCRGRLKVLHTLTREELLNRKENKDGHS